MTAPEAESGPLTLAHLTVLPDWIDYNGHMTESRYLFAASETTDAFLRLIGVDLAYVATGFSYFTAETHLRHLAQAHLGDAVTGQVQLLGADAKRLHLFVTLTKEGQPIATLEQMMLHVDMAAGRACPAPEAILARLAPIRAAHACLPRPTDAGRQIKPLAP